MGDYQTPARHSEEASGLLRGTELAGDGAEPSGQVPPPFTE